MLGIKSEITDEDYRKALYVLEENKRVKLFAKAVEEDNLTTLGQLLYQSHEGLSQDYKVSCAELDFLVEKAKSNSDVLGARMMGGGFGGCTINLVRKKGYKAFKRAISDAFQKQFKRECSIYRVKLSQGTHVVK